MGCSSSKEQPKGANNKAQEPKKAEKPQEPKKEQAPKKEEPKKEVAKKEEAPKQEAKPQEPVKPQEPAASAPKQESAKPSVRESEPAVQASVKESERASAKPSTASVHEVTPTPSERAATPPPAEPVAAEPVPAPAAARANVPQLQMADAQATPNRAAQTPRGERSISPRRYPVEVAIRRESVGGSPAARKVAVTDYSGPGPHTTFPVESVYRCFDEGNGLLFRLVNETYHTWAFYNDTEVYTMHVSVSFGHESMVRPLGKTTQEVHDAETGHCTLEVEVAPGETQPFMRGEYNGFVTYYDADPIPYESRKK